MPLFKIVCPDIQILEKKVENMGQVSLSSQEALLASLYLSAGWELRSICKDAETCLAPEAKAVCECMGWKLPTNVKV